MRAHNFSIPRSTLGIETKDGKFPITCCSTEEQLYKVWVDLQESMEIHY